MRNSLLGPALAIGLLGCSHSNKAQTTASVAPPVTQTASGKKCPVMENPGTNVVTTDTSNGVAIVFTTTGDITDLRSHVQQMADMHNSMVGTRSGDVHGSATVGGDVRGGVGDKDVNAGATGTGDVHAGAAGKDVNAGGKVGGDVHAGVAGKDVHAGGKVGGDVHAGAADKDVNAGGKVGGDVHAGVAGKDVHAGATVGGDVRGGASGGDVHAGGTTSGDVNAGVTGTKDLAGQTGTQPGMQPGMQSGMQSSMPMVASRATVEDIPGGERLVLVPEDPSQLPALRAEAREQVSMLERGECPMMGTEQQLQPTGNQPDRHPTGT